MAKRIIMKRPIVEINGDEMARIMWTMVRERLILPYVNLKTKYYDLSLKKRDETDDKITIEAGKAVKKYGVGVKCATITPDTTRVREYNLKHQLKSPNSAIRAILDGTLFRIPIVLKNIEPAVRFWKKPIIIGRHAYGDVYNNVEYRIDAPGMAELIYKPNKGKDVRLPIYEFESQGIVQAIHNKDSSIASFARTCFTYALDQKVDVWFAAKDTISYIYDARFKQIFEELYENEYKDKFGRAGITYFYGLIDDVMARVVESEGGFLWACKNYDGDIMSDFLGSAYGSLAIMKSVLVSPHGHFEYEAAHGTVQKHYYRHLKGEKTSTNSLATIFAWTGALRKRAESDNASDLIKFTLGLEKSAKETIEIDGIMTADLAVMSNPPANRVATTEEFIDAVDKRLQTQMNG